ncbi:MAG: 16S rRNA (cytosine(1402)-N(4))-methyltransferase RsmH [Proteobacteria bacterium]|nr:16S rRNA (cytosine(1402)-N(4))-methyltransferase RsmH [Pseudomonadota bacterium]
MDSESFVHRSVLPCEVVMALGCAPGKVYVDGTLGGGGHAEELLKASAPDGRVIGIDQDSDAVEASEKKLKVYGDRVTIVRESFTAMRTVLDSLGIAQVDGVLLDLGVSTHQLTSPTRGFSFRSDSRLDMRMDDRAGFSAYEVVNGYEETELARIFKFYGEERFAHRIAKAIVKARASRPIEGTRALAEVVVGAIPAKFHGRKTHPATKVFQAIRIVVNDEMESLKKGIEAGIASLAPGGRMAVISFHSLEDKIVKRAFAELADPCICPPRAPGCVCGRVATVKLLKRGSIKPGTAELEANPKARSARLRAIEKL